MERGQKGLCTSHTSPCLTTPKRQILNREAAGMFLTSSSSPIPCPGKGSSHAKTINTQVYSKVYSVLTRICYESTKVDFLIKQQLNNLTIWRVQKHVTDFLPTTASSIQGKGDGSPPRKFPKKSEKYK